MTSEQLVQRWLKDRQHLLVELVALSRGLRSRSTALDSLSARMQQFCDRLVDYVSRGHFEVYADLARAPQGSRLLTRLWTQLQATTDVALHFNETNSSGRLDRQGMALQLATLSVALEDRFRIEDRLVLAAKASTASGHELAQGVAQRLAHEKTLERAMQTQQHSNPMQYGSAPQPGPKAGRHLDVVAPQSVTQPALLRARRSAPATISASA